MLVYIPQYTDKWEIVVEESEELKQLGKSKSYTKYKQGVGHYGSIYDLPYIFTSEKACKQYIYEWITDYESVWNPEA